MLCQHFMAPWLTTDESDTPSGPVGPPHIAASLLTDGSLPLSIEHDQLGGVGRVGPIAPQANL